MPRRSIFQPKAIIGLTALAAVLAALFWQFGFDWSARFKKRPNVVFIVIDALREDHLGCYGYSRQTSPFMDWLSRRGVFFRNVISQSSWTKTAIASLLASLYPEAHGIRRVRDVLPKELLLISEVFKTHGYRTCCVQSNAWLKTEFGFNQGYDNFVYNASLRASEMNRQALEWLDQEKDRPFFLYLHYMDVHNPYLPPPQFLIFGKERIDRYDGAILHMDTKMKELFQELEKRNLIKNTWIVITSDHGDEFYEHGGLIHARTLYNEVLRVPLIFYHPGVPRKGKAVKRQVRHIDVALSVLDLARIPIPETMEGISLKRNIAWAFDFQDNDLEAFSQVGLNDLAPGQDLIAMTTPDSKYIYNFKNGRQQLYDLRMDPQEKHNLATSRSDLTKTLRERVERFRKIEGLKRTAIIEKAEIDEELKELLRSLGYLR